MADSTNQILISTPQNMTGAWADIKQSGDVVFVDTGNHDFITLWVDATLNGYKKLMFRALSDIDTIIKDYPLPFHLIKPTENLIDREEFTLDDAGHLSDHFPLVQFTVDNSIPRIHFQSKVGTATGTQGVINTIYYTLGYNAS